jgi:hypothetical protein
MHAHQLVCRLRAQPGLCKCCARASPPILRATRPGCCQRTETDALKAGLTPNPERNLKQVSPIGRNCSQSERDDFEKYDHEHKIRSTMVSKLESEFADYGLKYSIGGQVQDRT